MRYAMALKQFITQKGYIPEIYNAYNNREITDISPTITTYVSDVTSIGGVSIIEVKKENGNKKEYGSSDRHN